MFKIKNKFFIIFFVFFCLADIFANNRDNNLINLDKKILRYAKSKKKYIKLKLQELINIKEAISHNLLLQSLKEKQKSSKSIAPINEKKLKDENLDPIIAEYKENINIESQNFVNKNPVLKIKDSKDKIELDEIKLVYKDFVLNFKSKNFLKCRNFLSQNDFNKIKNELEFNKMDSSFDNILELNIKNIWNTYYDPLFRNDIIFNLKKNFNLYINDIKKEINDLKKKNKTFEIEQLEEQMDYEKKRLQSEILFLKAKIEPFGEILDYCLYDKKCILIVNFRYNFVNVEEFSNLKDIIKIQNFKAFNFIEPNILNVYDAIFFVKEENNWKISFFSHDQFSNEKFIKFLNKYKN